VNCIWSKRLEYFVKFMYKNSTSVTLCIWSVWWFDSHRGRGGGERYNFWQQRAPPAFFQVKQLMRAGQRDARTHGGQNLQAAAVGDAAGRQNQLLQRRRRRCGRRRFRCCSAGGGGSGSEAGLLSINTDGGGEGRGGGGGERSGGHRRRRFALNAAAGGQLQGAVAAQLGPTVILHDTQP
jgi:hypothetical protein